MAVFFTEVMDDLTASAFLEGVRRKFHYDETQADELRKTAEEMMPLLRGEAFWEHRKATVEKLCPGTVPSAEYEHVVISLGKGIDDLQESYGKETRLSQSYMIEVLASELLMKSYDAYNRYIRKNTDRHVARYHFPGSEEAFPLKLLPELLKGLTSKVVCNSAFCMQPKKSVAFVSELTRDEKVQCKGICVGCNNVYCSNRMADDGSVRKRLAEMADMPLTYGYSRIFGIGR